MKQYAPSLFIEFQNLSLEFGLTKYTLNNFRSRTISVDGWNAPKQSFNARALCEKGFANFHLLGDLSRNFSIILWVMCNLIEIEYPKIVVVCVCSHCQFKIIRLKIQSKALTKFWNSRQTNCSAPQHCYSIK